MPDWSDRTAVAVYPPQARRSSATTPPLRARPPTSGTVRRACAGRVQIANQMGMVFSKLNCKPRWRRRLSGSRPQRWWCRSPRSVLPVGNGRALARGIPGARLLVLEQAATAIPDATAGEVAAAMLALWALTVRRYNRGPGSLGLEEQRCHRRRGLDLWRSATRRRSRASRLTTTSATTASMEFDRAACRVPSRAARDRPGDGGLASRELARLGT